MALLDLEHVKRHLLIWHDADDTYLTQLIVDSEDKFQGYINRPIEGEEVTEYFVGGRDRLILSYFPLDMESVVVTDTVTGDPLPSNEVEVQAQAGFVFNVSASSKVPRCWRKGVNRWRVTYTSGLIYHPQWDIYLEDTIRASLLDVVADWYEQRSPGLQEERFGGGAVVSYVVREIPDRVRRVWDDIGRDLIG